MSEDGDLSPFDDPRYIPGILDAMSSDNDAHFEEPTGYICGIFTKGDSKTVRCPGCGAAFSSGFIVGGLANTSIGTAWVCEACLEYERVVAPLQYNPG